MSSSAGETVGVEVDGVRIGVVRWSGRPGAPTAFGLHGITANAWSWAVVARHLAGDISLVAIDMRGRGTSSQVPRPYGIRRHADDVAAVIRQLNAAPAVVAGHSMGAYVALACAERHPSAVSDLVLVDGGVPLPVPDDVDPQTALERMMGPAIERLQRVWIDRVQYETMWADHPAFAGGLTPDIERYVLSDLVPCEGGFRSAVSEEAVRHDGAELLIDEEIRSLLERRAEPATIIRAETGLMAAPPSLIEAAWMERLPNHDWRTIAGTNHYDVLIGEAGAAAVAEAIRQRVNSQR